MHCHSPRLPDKRASASRGLFCFSNANWSGLAIKRSRTNFGSSSAPTDKGPLAVAPAPAPKWDDDDGDDDDEVGCAVDSIRELDGGEVEGWGDESTVVVAILCGRGTTLGD